MVSHKEKSYRQIIKSTSIFGGVKIFEILVTIVRTKLVAVLIGPEGIGIQGLFNSTLGLIRTGVSLGLDTSAIKGMSSSIEEGNEESVSHQYSVVKTVFKYSGLLGLAVILFLSPIWSELVFGGGYVLSFLVISIALFFDQISEGSKVILRATRNISLLAKGGILVSLTSLFVSVPLYYFLGIKGIVPSIILISVISVLIFWILERKLDLRKVYITFNQLKEESSDMIKMGAAIGSSTLLVLISSFILRLFISHVGGVAQVGLYTAGFAIVNTYVGLIFTAMSTDYYPRLAMLTENGAMNDLMNHQSFISVLILAPLLVTLICFIEPILTLIYSIEFIEVSIFIQYSCLGMFFKAGSHALAYIFIAKQEKKLFFWNELVTNIYFFVFNIVGYYLGGLEGLGIAFLLSYLFYFLQVAVIIFIKYSMIFENKVIVVFVVQLLLSCIAIYFFRQTFNILGVLFKSILVSVSIIISLRYLGSVMNIRDLFNRKRGG